MNFPDFPDPVSFEEGLPPVYQKLTFFCYLVADCSLLPLFTITQATIKMKPVVLRTPLLAAPVLGVGLLCAKDDLAPNSSIASCLHELGCDI